jgi:hypothetical protein
MDTAADFLPEVFCTTSTLGPWFTITFCEPPAKARDSCLMPPTILVFATMALLFTTNIPGLTAPPNLASPTNTKAAEWGWLANTKPAGGNGAQPM